MRSPRMVSSGERLRAFVPGRAYRGGCAGLPEVRVRAMTAWPSLLAGVLAVLRFAVALMVLYGLVRVAVYGVVS